MINETKIHHIYVPKNTPNIKLNPCIILKASVIPKRENPNKNVKIAVD